MMVAPFYKVQALFANWVSLNPFRLLSERPSQTVGEFIA
jgi:hypothetical protein